MPLKPAHGKTIAHAEPALIEGEQPCRWADYSIAFAASDVEGMRKRLQSKNVKLRESIVPPHGRHAILSLRPRRRRRGTEFSEGLTTDSAATVSGFRESRQGHMAAISRARSRLLFLNFA
jgi:hypothetical protein